MPTSDLFSDELALQTSPVVLSQPVTAWLRSHWERNVGTIETLIREQSVTFASRSSEDDVVLVVDDQACIAITLSQILIRHGYQSVWLTDPLTAATLLDKLPLRLLITDIDMPGIDGVTLTMIAREKKVFCPILLFSGRGSECEEAVRLCRMQPRTRVQVKPVAPSVLLDLLGEMLRESGGS